MLNNKEFIKNKMVELEEGFTSNTEIEVDCLTDYDQGYITDIYSEIADGWTEIYTAELFKIGYDLYTGGYTERAIEEFGHTDLIQILMTADYLRHEEVLYDNDEDLRLYYVLSILEDLDIEDLDIEEVVDNIDLQADRLDTLEDNTIDTLEMYR